MLRPKAHMNGLLDGGILCLLVSLLTNSWGVFGIGLLLAVCGIIKEVLK